VATRRAIAQVTALRTAYFQLLEEFGVERGGVVDLDWRTRPMLVPIRWVSLHPASNDTSTPILSISLPPSATRRERVRWRAMPDLDLHAKCYVRHAVGICADVRCHQRARIERLDHDRGKWVPVRNPWLCHYHNDWWHACRPKDLTNIKQAVSTLGRDLGIQINSTI
jgi:hypothetical protein